VCELDEADVCRGCFRSRTEIALWTSMSPGEQWRVVEAAQRRRALQAASHAPDSGPKPS
jgi:predicted Fe-S protein YdhL (DUF1289 family)